jgi:hypothetical protein
MEVHELREYMTWVAHASPGEECVYHVGLLMRDRQYTVNGDKKNLTALDGMARSVMASAQTGVVRLFQRRLDPLICAYIAVKT